MAELQKRGAIHFVGWRPVLDGKRMSLEVDGITRAGLVSLSGPEPTFLFDDGTIFPLSGRPYELYWRR